MTTRAFGEPIRRREDPRLVRGEGRYLDDLGQGAYEAAFLRSPHASARILDIDVSRAIGLDGLIGIYTYGDLEDRMAEALPLLIPHPNLTAGRTGYPLAKEFVRHVGEAIVMVVAVNRYVAEDVVGLIDVSYELLPPVVGIDAARKAEHLVHADAPGNVAAHMIQQVGDAPAAIAHAKHKISLDLEIERSASTPLEGRGVYAVWDSDAGEMRLWSSTQTSTGVRAAVAAKLNLPLQKVECTAPDVGGGLASRSCTHGRRKY